MESQEIRRKYISFFKQRGHVEISAAPLIPVDDSTTLFTTSGMQQLVPFLLGKKHPQGKRLVDVQGCVRSSDIDDVGDTTHLTYFEMLGNWSLGDYFKKEQLSWVWEFFTRELGLPKERLYVTVFGGNKFIPRDEESYAVWRSLGVPDSRIFFYDDKKNWWSRSGSIDQMPPGEIGGVNSEIFYDFEIPHNKEYGDECHPNCGCGRFMEIGNSVFITYKKLKDNSLEELPNKNVDFGGGLERIVSAVNDKPDVYEIDLFKPIIVCIEEVSQKKYQGNDKIPMRVIADHLKAATFIISSGVVPSNKEHGYVLRRLLRRSMVKMYMLRGRNISELDFVKICSRVVEVYGRGYFSSSIEELLERVVSEEVGKFSRTLERGIKIFNKLVSEEKSLPFFSGEKAFFLYESFGFPLEITEELAKQRGFRGVDRESFVKEKEAHAKKSRTSSEGMFRGGLADKSEETKRLHTATHLLHQALREVLGDGVLQRGSNITPERLRFDFSFHRKLTPGEIKQVEDIVNEKIKLNLPVKCKAMSLDEAKEVGALALFEHKYKDKVLVYFIGDFSKEVCGGPHVKSTGELGRFKIVKEESVGANTRRIKAVLL